MSPPFPSSSPLPATVTALAQQLTEETSIRLFEQIRYGAIQTPLAGEPVQTAYVTNDGTNATGDSFGHEPENGPENSPASDLPPLLLLHGFDSSLLEFRRLYPLLGNGQNSGQREVWLMDYLGFGFSDRPSLPLNPEILKAHLRAFWQAKIARPMVLIGASMGGAAAIDFATSYPEAVAQLVLIDSAGYQNGPTIGKFLFDPIDQWAVNFLRQPGVRRRISCNAYANPDRFVTPDAECCAALHLQMPGWDRALKAFTRSGGYPKLRDRLPQITAPTLLLWGKQDRILGTQDAVPMAQAIPQAQLQWIDNSGHVPHLEQPLATANAILAFIASPQAKPPHPAQP